MSLAEDAQMNEVVRKLQSNETPTFDDIYVPGIGVRGALSDDGAESSDFHSGVGERCARGAAFVNRWAIRTFGNVRRVGSRLTVRLTRINTQRALRYRPKFMTHLTNPHGRDLQQTQRYLFNATQSALSMLRNATRNKLAFSALLTETISRILRKTRSWLQPISWSASVQIHRANEYRLSLPPIAAIVAQNLRLAQSFARGAVVGSRNRLLTAANYKVLLRFAARHKPDLPTLRRAAAPLAILLVMVVFVIQEIVLVIQR
jgi:hypothetical protein